jgi:hypothetical protein
MSGTATEACDRMIRIEAECFKHWCYLFDPRGKQDPHVVVASQEPLHRAAEDLRRLCLADPQTAEAERQELMRMQAEGEIRCEAGIKRERTAAAREMIRQRWVSERWRIIESRDALAIGLGWPHRGELVTIDTWHGRDGEELHVTGTAMYLNSYDTHNVGHQVWVPEVSANRHEGTLLVQWEPRQDRWGNADPAGDIGLRVQGAQSRRLPVPLPRWPTPDDIEGGIDHVRSTPVGAQLELFR